MRSARRASSVAEPSRADEDVAGRPKWMRPRRVEEEDPVAVAPVEGFVPRWPSFIAMVERPEREVVVEFGVEGPMSEGVTVPEGGAGISMKVGCG